MIKSYEQRQSDVKVLRFEKQKWIKELTPFLHIWKNVNTGNDILGKKIVSSPDEDPLNSFFTLELENSLKLVKKVHGDLTVLSKILRGAALVSNEIFDLALDLMQAKTPEGTCLVLSSAWQAMWEGPENPSTFMKDVMANAIAVSNWRDAVKAGTLLSNPIQLSKLFNPLTFLNALRQQTARKGLRLF